MLESTIQKLLWEMFSKGKLLYYTKATKLVLHCYTVWKFGTFPTTQVFIETNFCEPGVSKSAILIVSAPLKFDFSEFWHFESAEID